MCYQKLETKQHQYSRHSFKVTVTQSATEHLSFANCWSIFEQTEVELAPLSLILYILWEASCVLILLEFAVTFPLVPLIVHPYTHVHSTTAQDSSLSPDNSGGKRLQGKRYNQRENWLVLCRFQRLEVFDSFHFQIWLCVFFVLVWVAAASLSHTVCLYVYYPFLSPPKQMRACVSWRGIKLHGKKDNLLVF